MNTHFCYTFKQCLFTQFYYFCNVSVRKISRRSNGLLLNMFFTHSNTIHKRNEISLNRFCSFEVKDELVEYTSLYKGMDFDAITEGDQKKIDALKLLQLEVDIMFQEGRRVPNKMSTNNWKELLLCTSKTARIDYLKHLWYKELARMIKKKNQTIKSEKFKNQKDQMQNTSDEHTETYNLYNCFFPRINDSRINHTINYRSLQASMFSSDIVIDCGLCAFMTRKDIFTCAKQIVFMMSENRYHKDPSNIVFCNVDYDGVLFQQIRYLVPTIDSGDYFLNWTEKDYTEIYPKKNLVYITSSAMNDLKHFDSDRVYVIGALINKVKLDNPIFARARREGIQMAKFPFDDHLMWKTGSKILPFNQTVNILNDLKLTGDWKYAFKHVPKRKLLLDDSTSINQKKGDNFNSLIKIYDVHN